MVLVLALACSAGGAIGAQDRATGSAPSAIGPCRDCIFWSSPSTPRTPQLGERDGRQGDAAPGALFRLDPSGSAATASTQKALTIRQQRQELLTTLGLLVVAMLLMVLLALNQSKKRLILLKTQELAETEARYQLLFEHSPVALMEADFSEVRDYLDELTDMGIKHLDRFFEQHPDAVHLCMAMIRVVDHNHAMRRLYDMESGQRLDALPVLLPEGETGGVLAQILGLIATGQFAVVTEHRTLKGTRKQVDLRGALAAGYEGSWDRVYISALDITEQMELKAQRRRFEQQLQQSQKMEAIGSLAGGIAHDFNNILSPIVGHADLLREVSRGDATINRHAQGILDGALRARSLIGQILTFSKETDKDIQPVQLHTVIDEVLNLSRSTIPENITLTYACPSDLPLIRVDPTELHQVVMNLLTNAIYAMTPQGGKLDLVAALVKVGLNSGTVELAPGSYVTLSIADSGHGMAANVVAKIFEPYFTTKGPGKGTGLGLAVVHGIVKGYNGTINVTSEPGQGTTFTLFLPVVDEPFPAQEEDTAVEASTLARGDGQILLVDDEPSILEVTEFMLSHLGYKVTACGSGQEALEILAADPQRFDLVLSDLTMPQMSGLALYQQMQALRADIRVILCTGFSEQYSTNQMMHLGICAVLSKPLAMAELASTVREVLDQPTT